MASSGETTSESTKNTSDSPSPVKPTSQEDALPDFNLISVTIIYLKKSRAITLLREDRSTAGDVRPNNRAQWSQFIHYVVMGGRTLQLDKDCLEMGIVVVPPSADAKILELWEKAELKMEANETINPLEISSNTEPPSYPFDTNASQDDIKFEVVLIDVRESVVTVDRHHGYRLRNLCFSENRRLFRCVLSRLSEGYTETAFDKKTFDSLTVRLRNNNEGTDVAQEGDNASFEAEEEELNLSDHRRYPAEASRVLRNLAPKPALSGHHEREYP
ncbi:uncharacterized protein KY384_004084 [Bacidia gigantensis]|uniref:uncharacterized protein n=1 Tax=Bacidia gigantensis TaxID=2732470 RepID=UPI001D05A0D1|nr:uncharacterized protein KY384_004084 [Bacidia gigantensis]KAG8530727.1 hypothetical protein KY384_004084 [Bacidia gigantensis]